MANPIESETEYQVALSEVEALIDLNPEPDSEDGRRLVEVANLVEAYEAKHYPMS